MQTDLRCYRRGCEQHHRQYWTRVPELWTQSWLLNVELEFEPIASRYNYIMIGS